MNPDAIQAARAERREAELVLQPAELTLNSGAATVEAHGPFEIANPSY